jgi:hypothetical protein
MSPRNRELTIFGVLFFVGLVILPVCIYVVGINLIGEYSPEAGISGLLMAIWGDLARLRIGAWILVLSPWLVIQLLRLAIRIWRGGQRTINPAGN